MRQGKIAELALASGFSHSAPLDVDTIAVREEVRAACAENKCRAYNANWSCPPACGTLPECEAVIRKFKKGFLMQTTGILEDSLDYESMEQTGKDHTEHLFKFAKMIKELYPACLVLGAGGCKKCEKCTYPDAPCRFPADMTHSMEAFGMIVSDVCKDNNLPYYYGKNTLTFTGCVLVE
jgi:predicted metal-binding protein